MEKMELGTTSCYSEVATARWIVSLNQDGYFSTCRVSHKLYRVVSYKANFGSIPKADHGSAFKLVPVPVWIIA